MNDRDCIHRSPKRRFSRRLNRSALNTREANAKYSHSQFHPAQTGTPRHGHFSGRCECPHHRRTLSDAPTGVGPPRPLSIALTPSHAVCWPPAVEIPIPRGNSGSPRFANVARFYNLERDWVAVVSRGLQPAIPAETTARTRWWCADIRGTHRLCASRRIPQ